MNLKVLIVDDETLSRERIRHFLRTEPATEIVGECCNGVEAVSAIHQKSPDLVFLDVRMPGLDGFGVLATIAGNRLPAIIFTTAHDEFAVQAFDIHAVDYLLKPFSRSRFQVALDRARERLQNGTASPADPSLRALLKTIDRQPALPDCIPIRSSGRITFVRSVDVDWISAADNYAELHVGASTHLMRTTLTELADRLPEGRFARISRSALVNLDRVKELRPKSHGDFVILLRNGTSVAGSRNYRQNLAAVLGKPS